MNKYDFIQYAAQRYGIDESFAETLVDIFTDSLQELISAGQCVDIDGLGEFQTIPLFPNGLSYTKKQNTLPDNKTDITPTLSTNNDNFKRHFVSFKPSKDLTLSTFYATK